MKKLLLLFAIILIAAPIFAGLQLDLDIHLPYYAGATLEDQSIGDVMEYAFIIPDVKLNYFIGPKILRIGVGLKSYTVVVQSLIYPIVSVESKLGPLVLNANAGGIIYSMFGVINSFEPSELLIGEASIAYKFGVISLGTGMTLITSQELLKSSTTMYVGTVFVRFTF